MSDHAHVASGARRNDRARARIGVVIVEDEERARRTLRDLVRADAEFELLAETAGEDAPTVIDRCRPDILLLDVQMPVVDGFEVLRRLTIDPPVVIFVTAYDRYALDAFECAAVDYLLKPFSDDRFAAALQRGKDQARLRRLGTGDGGHDLRRLLASAAAHRAPDRLLVRDGSRTLVVDPREIDWVEADGVYVRLHSAGRRSVPIRESLNAMESRLAGRGFYRIHRSALVNVARVLELEHRSHGDYAVRLRDGTELTLARTRKHGLQERLRRPGG